MNREAQLLGLTEMVGQGLADAGPAVGGIIGAGCGYWWHTARAMGALLTTMEVRGAWAHGNGGSGGGGGGGGGAFGIVTENEAPLSFYKAVR